MLRTEAIDSGLALTERFDARDIYLEALPGSPLARLMSASRVEPAAAMMGTRDVGYSVNTSYIQANADLRDSITHSCLHDDSQDEIVRQFVQGARSHLMTVRTLVIPAADELTKGVKARIAAMPGSALLGMEVVVQSICPLLKNPALISMADKFKNVALDSPTLNMRLPDMSVEEIIELMKTGTKSLDDEVSVWVKMLPEGCVERVFTGLFQVRDRVYDDFQQAMQDREYGADHAVIAFLIARKLVEKAVPGIQMSADQLRTLAAEYREQAAKRISIAVDIASRDAANGMLVKSTGYNKVTVNEDVYRQWVATGGKNEALLGMLLSDRAMYTVNDINQASDKLVKGWEQYLSLQMTAESNTRYRAIIAAIRSEFKELLGVQRLTQSGPDLNAYNREKVLSLFEEEIKKVRGPDLDNLSLVCMRLICRTRFPDTDAEDFLTKMVELQSTNPSLAPTEIATLAAIDYIAGCVASQIVLK